jgi:RNA polymerase sigma factor (TIGR02999 family)
MPDVTRILELMKDGKAAAEQLLPLVYEELRALANQKIAREKPGQTLQATALVHEAYLRLVDVDAQQKWDGRGHFFAAAAEAMRRILVERARRKKAVKHGGERNCVDLDDTNGIDAIAIELPLPNDDLLAIDDALTKLAEIDPDKAELVKLRYFAGLTIEQCAKTMGISIATANRYWAYSRAWLFERVSRGNP